MGFETSRDGGKNMRNKSEMSPGETSDRAAARRNGNGQEVDVTESDSERAKPEPGYRELPPGFCDAIPELSVGV